MPKPNSTEQFDIAESGTAAIRSLRHEGMAFAAQTRTDAGRKALIDSLDGGGNVHANRKTKR